MTLAEKVAAFATWLSPEVIPAEVAASVRLRVLDVIGLALAASTYEFAAPLRQLAAAGGGGKASVIGTTLTSGVPFAAMVNGALAHGLDFDDTHPGSITHASAVIVPTVLAIGEDRGLSGPAMIRAAVAGYETIARVGLAAPGVFHARGWHATGVCGALAATVAAGAAEGLDAERLTHALGVAGSFAGGLLEFLADGSAVKRLHPGWAAHSGVVAAALARAGVNGPRTVLEGRFGVYHAFVGREPDPTPFDTLGATWETLRVAFKPYPCCHYLHAYLDCALALRAQHAIASDAIADVECRVPGAEIPVICEPRANKVAPRTTYEAQFSLPYSVAAALADGAVGLDTYRPERLHDTRVLGLADRVRHVVDPSSTFPDGFPGWVRVRLSDGRVLEVREPDGRGGARRPLPPAAIVEKFRANASRALPGDRVAAIEHAVLSLDALRDAADLMRLCRV